MLRVLVTGGPGTLGSDMAARLLRAGYDTFEEEVDVLAPAAARRAVRGLQPDVLLDCGQAGGAHEDLGRGASNLAAAAARNGAYSVYMSSVEVFDGDAEMPYLESDSPRPATPLGEAQAEAEAAVAGRNPRHAIIRTSALFGYGAGDAVDVVLAEARSGRVEADVTGRISPTYSVHVADAAVTLVDRKGYGVFHVPGGGSCTELQFARAVLRMTGSRAEAVAATPGIGVGSDRRLVLGSCRDVPPCPDWRIALRAYLKLRRPGAEEPEGLRS